MVALRDFSISWCAALKVLAVPVIAACVGCSTTKEPIVPVAQKLEQAGATLTTPLAIVDLDVGLKAPPVSIGDTFVFDNPPTQWTVISIDGPLIGWSGDKGQFLQTSWSALLPPLRWTGPDNTVNAGQRKLAQLKGNFYPLKKGNRVTFFEETLYSRPGAVIRSSWQCDVGDESEITVPAGKAMAWEVICHVNGQERQVMYYSEKIGNNVRIAEKRDGGLAIQQLTGYLRGRATGVTAPTSKSGSPQ